MLIRVGVSTCDETEREREGQQGVRKREEGVKHFERRSVSDVKRDVSE
jgi:hypothetical protein